MIVINRTIPYTSDVVFHINFLGDLHLGSRHCQKKAFLQDVDRIKEDPYGLWISTGDNLDAIVPSDSKRFRAEEVDPDYLPHLNRMGVYQRDQYLRYVDPIKDKCLGVIDGNHEMELGKRTYVNLTADIAMELGVPYLSDTALIRLTFARMEGDKRICSDNLIIYACHGHAFGKHSGTPLNRMEQMAGLVDADMYICGHAHKKAVSKSCKVGITSKGKAALVNKPQLFGVAGCFTTVYEEDTSGYAQRSQYGQTDVGSLMVSFRPMTGEMDAKI